MSRKRSSRGYKITQRRIRLLRARDGDACQWCDKLIDFTILPGVKHGPSVDHIIPRAAGGRNDLPNLQLVHCDTCGNKKGAWHNGINYAQLADPNFPPVTSKEIKRSTYTVDPWIDGSDWDTPVLQCAPPQRAYRQEVPAIKTLAQLLRWDPKARKA